MCKILWDYILILRDYYQKKQGEVMQNASSFRCLSKPHRFHMVLRWINILEELNKWRQSNDCILHLLWCSIIFSIVPGFTVFQKNGRLVCAPSCSKCIGAFSRFLQQLMHISYLGKGGCRRLQSRCVMWLVVSARNDFCTQWLQ